MGIEKPANQVQNGAPNASPNIEVSNQVSNISISNTHLSRVGQSSQSNNNARAKCSNTGGNFSIFSCSDIDSWLPWINRWCNIRGWFYNVVEINFPIVGVVGSVAALVCISSAGFLVAIVATIRENIYARLC
jgi:hypothetical protein